MSYEKYKDTIKATNEARRAAVKELIDRHREEFNSLYIAEAETRGLNPSKIRGEIERAQRKQVEQEELQRIIDEKVAEALRSQSE